MAKAAKPTKSVKKSSTEGMFKLNMTFEEAIKLAVTTPLPKKKKAKK